MAKNALITKETAIATTKKSKTGSIKDAVTKTFGDQIILDGRALVDNKLMIIPVSPVIDILLGGGVPEGSFMVLTGQPKCGKTTTSLDFAATAQQEKYNGTNGPRHVYYLNIEGRLKKRDLEGIAGLDLDRFHIIGSQQGKILRAEEYLQIAERIINEEPECVLIIDSYSALCTEAEITSDMSKMQRADGAKLLAKFCRKVANVIPVNKNIVIGITHLMGNPTGYGAEFKEKSGQAVAYQTDIKLRAKTFKSWVLSGDNTPIGQEIEWTVVCSAIGPPGASMTSYVRYGQGIDKAKELVMLGSDFGLIKAAGAWYTTEFMGEKAQKFQGAEKVRDFLLENPEAYEELYSKIKEMMGIKNVSV